MSFSEYWLADMENEITERHAKALTHHLGRIATALERERSAKDDSDVAALAQALETAMKKRRQAKVYLRGGHAIHAECIGAIERVEAGMVHFVDDDGAQAIVRISAIDMVFFGAALPADDDDAAAGEETT